MSPAFTPPIGPNLFVKELADIYLRKNFDNLDQYFKSQNQLYGFQFKEIVFTQAQATYTFPHGMSVIPQDVFVTQLTGVGSVSFLYGQFTLKNIVLSVTGPCRLRFFYGTYWNQQPQVSPQPSDAMAFGPAASGFQTGMILYWASATPPLGFILYTDAALSQADYPGLAALFGTTYARTGDAPTTFRLPPGESRCVVIAGAGTGLTARALGGQGGEETHRLTTPEIPSHTHVQDAHHHDISSDTAYSSGAPGLSNTGTTNGQRTSNSSKVDLDTVATNQTTGGGGAHNNMQPYTVLYAIVKT